MPPNPDYQDTARVKSWPQFKPGNREPSRLIKLLLNGAGLDPDSAVSRDKVNAWLKTAWEELTCRLQILQSQGGGGYTLNRNIMTFALPQNAWV